MPSRTNKLHALLFTLVPLALSACGGSSTTSSSTPGAISLSATSLTFAAQAAGTSSAAQTVTISNTGGSTLSLSGISVTGSSVANFSETTTCGASLAVGAGCTVWVVFNPSAAGSFSDTVSIADSAANSPQTVIVSGTGTAPAATLTSTTLTFSQLIASTSPTQAVTLTNSGSAAMTISAITVGGANASAFTATNTCGTSLAAGASCAIAVSFTPAATGTYAASVSIADNATGSPQTIALSGTGTAPTATLSATMLTFSQPVGGTSASQVVMLSNNGSAPLTLSGITLGGANASNFTETNSCGTTVAVGANCTITVSFTPAAIATYAASVSIADNATGSPQSIMLTGSGIQPGVVSLSTPSLTFTTAAESVSAVQTVTLTNTGNAALNISGISLTGSNAANFTETTTCGATVAISSSCTISVSFSPFLVLTNGYAANVVIANNSLSPSVALPLTGTATGTLSINTSNPSDWVISTGAITFKWSSTTGNLVSAILNGTTDQLVDTAVTSGGQPDGLYMDNTGQGSATPTANYQQVGNEYIDWWINYPSNSANAFTYTEHFVVTANDPGLHVYFVANHSATDIAGSLGQVQYVFRISQIFNNTYSNNSGLNNLGVTQIPLPPSQYINSADPGRAVQNAAVDLHGFPVTPGFNRNFYTKYDYSSYEYLHQQHGLYSTGNSGTNYGAWTILPSTESMVGGPTKQDLIFTGNILMMEMLSNHLDNNLGYTPAQGVASTRLFGPFNFEFNKFDTIHTTPASLYAEASQYKPFYNLLYDNDTTLAANSYTASTARGNVAATVAGGGSTTANTAWTVLSDSAKNFQYTNNGAQYWTNNTSATGAATLNNVIPGTYRLSSYVLGQWGELRYDGVTVKANQTTTLPAMTFTPENFSSAAPIWTIGTPDRSAHEFLHGTNTTTGQDDREFWGNWNYWADFAANNGLQVYYATAEGSTPASNNLNLINYVQWGTFDPGLYGGVYNASDDTTDGYNYIVPSYIGTANVATARSPGLAVHFTTTAAQQAQGQYVVLSMGLAAVEGSVVATLNGTQLIWHYINASDAMVRSGLSGYYQWVAFQYPTSLLKAAGADNVLNITVSQIDGVMIDAMRMEITGASADPAVTGWNDYEYVSSSKYTPANDAIPSN